MPDRDPTAGHRLARLTSELTEAVLRGDHEGEVWIRSQMEAIAAAVRKQPKAASGACSRERRRIVRAINRALEQIRKHDPVLARILRATLQTRGLFSYSPASAESSAAADESELGCGGEPRRDR